MIIKVIKSRSTAFVGKVYDIGQPTNTDGKMLFFNTGVQIAGRTYNPYLIRGNEKLPNTAILVNVANEKRQLVFNEVQIIEE